MFCFPPDAKTKKSQRKRYLMLSICLRLVLPICLWFGKLTTPFKFSCVSSGEWLGFKFLKSVADDHNDCGIWGVTEHKNCAFSWQLGISVPEDVNTVLGGFVAHFISNGCMIRGMRMLLHPLWLSPLLFYSDYCCCGLLMSFLSCLVTFCLVST